jgi:hypothetical protein
LPEFSTTSNTAVPPSSLVVSPSVGFTVMFASSSSVVITVSV